MLSKHRLYFLLPTIGIGAMLAVYLLLALFFRGRAAWYPRVSELWLLLTALLALAALLNAAIRSRRLNRRAALAQTLASAAQKMGTSLDMQAVPGLILEELAKVVPYERCSVMLEKKDHLYIAAQRGFPTGERVREVNIPIRDDDPYLKLADSQQPLILADVTQVPGWTILPWLPLNKAWMGVPLMVRDHIIGMFSMTRKDANAFSAEDGMLAMAFAGQAAVTLDNAQLYGDLNRAYRALKILDSAKSSFIEVVAHELRTPLTVMKGYTQVLGSQPAVKAEGANVSLVEGILNGVERMHVVVNNMLDLSKIENQVLQLHKETTSLAELFKRIASFNQKNLTERNLTLQIEDLDSLPAIQADPDLLYKVFMQLLTNAMKYTPDGGQITVTGKVEPSGREVTITIADCGIGINPEQIEVIFEKFHQTGQVALHSSGTTKFKGGGPGLGLPIARGIVAAHGGAIWAESPGQDEKTCPGSKFFVQLPV
jgi:signal transduction histidine kinase